MTERWSAGDLPPRYEIDMEIAVHPGVEHAAMPPVDFVRLATSAVEGGIFRVDPDIAAKNDASGFRLPMPDSLLKIPYNNGPLWIERFGEDIPVALMNQVRKNTVHANRLLLPTDSLMRYFHHRFTAPDVFASVGMQTILDEYRPRASVIAEGNRDPRSFQLRDRTVHDRDLYTREEMNAAIAMGRDHPAIVMSVIGYQGTINDYLGELGGAFYDLSLTRPELGIGQDQLEQYERFTGNWGTSNFLDNLLPAIAIQLHNGGAALPDTSVEALLHARAFRNAVDFMIGNGALRNFVTVPAIVASDGKERINHFLCPAVNSIREHLIDGSVLHHIYRLADSQVRVHEPAAAAMAARIRAAAEGSFAAASRQAKYERQHAEEEARPVVLIETEDRTWPQIAGAAIGRALEKNKPASFTFEGVEYLIPPADIEDAVIFDQARQPGDEVYEVQSGSFLYGVVSLGVERALASDSPFFFLFNDEPWRIDPEQVKALLARYRPAAG